MDGRGYKIVTQGEHLGDGRHFSSIAVIKGVGASGNGRGGGGFDGHQPGALAVQEILAQKRKSQAREVRASANTTDDHVRVFTSQVHLLKGFFAYYRLV